MNNTKKTFSMSEYKRKYRELEPETKQKISQANKNKKKNEKWRQNIALSMVEYWRSVGHKPISGETL